MVFGHGDYHYRHEPIAYGYVLGPGRWGRGARGWYGGNGQDSVIEVPRPVASTDHPTMKPVELIRRCLANSTRERDAVLDPFCGSEHPDRVRADGPARVRHGDRPGLLLRGGPAIRGGYWS